MGWQEIKFSTKSKELEASLRRQLESQTSPADVAFQNVIEMAQETQEKFLAIVEENRKEVKEIKAKLDAKEYNVFQYK